MVSVGAGYGPGMTQCEDHIMDIRHVSPEWQARQDWREEGVFRPEKLIGLAAQRYCREADRIEREWSQAFRQGGQHHVE
ncbi:hypothetical protein GCM10027172_16810 [Halomonas garicola]